MTRIQQIHWKLEMDYIGHPYYVSGNAIMHALGRKLSRPVHEQLHASHGMFVPDQFGTFPEEHSQNGSHPSLGGGLPEVDAYDDLFLFRDPFQSWLLDSRPRDALNTHDIRTQSGHPAFAHETIVGRPEEHRYDQRTTYWYVNAYVHADNPGTLPLREDALDGLQFGGKRNYGYGSTQLEETQVIDLENLDYTCLEKSDAYLLELVTLFILESEYPNAHDQDVPWWWRANQDELREREENVFEQCEEYRLQTIDHGQVVRYEGNRPLETAKRGILGVGSHSKYGFGELRVAPIEPESNQSRNTEEPTITP